MSKMPYPSETFKVKLNSHWFFKGDTINVENMKLKVLERPNWRNRKWYHKVINFITFGLLCKEVVYYTVKPIDNE